MDLLYIFEKIDNQLYGGPENEKKMTSIKSGVGGKIGKIGYLRILGWFLIPRIDFSKFSIFQVCLNYPNSFTYFITC